jgi:hypothetical protein
MRYLPLFLLPLAVMFSYSHQEPARTPDGSLIAVLSQKWSKSRQVLEKLNDNTQNPLPQPAMSPQNRNFARNVRVNDPAGVRDPNQDTTDGRAAALEKIVQESRSTQSKPLDGFSYKVKIQNNSTKVVDILFWEYRFADNANPSNLARRQFLCGVNIKPGKGFEVKAFSLSGPSDVVHVDTLAKDQANPFTESVVINRVEYADGSIWQRKDWNFAEIRLTYQRAVGTPWGEEMCRGL